VSVGVWVIAPSHPGSLVPQGPRSERVGFEPTVLMLSPEELVAVDDFRFKKRMPSRAAAVRELLRRGLAAEGFGLALAGAKSADYGVIGDAPSQMRRDAQRR
jgi:hypothetical protein